jgi:hypothetical protein
MTPAFRLTIAGGAPARRSKLRVIVAFGGVLLVWWLLRAIANPWAFAWLRPLTGAPTLVGTWYGEITTASGRKQRIALDLDAHFHACRGGGSAMGLCARLEAAARVCDVRGQRAYEGSGKTANWRGTAFRVSLHAADERSDGPRFIDLRSTHEGEAVRASVEFQSGDGTAVAIADRQGVVVRPGADPDTLAPATLVLCRSGAREFELACSAAPRANPPQFEIRYQRRSPGFVRVRTVRAHRRQWDGGRASEKPPGRVGPVVSKVDRLVQPELDVTLPASFRPI